MKRYIPLAIVFAILSSSCVSSKLYDDLQQNYEALKAENRDLLSRLDNQQGGNAYDLERAKKELIAAKKTNTQLAMDLAAAKNNYDRLKASYDALEANSSGALTENLERNRKLLAELEEKERRLTAEEERLTRLQELVKNKSERVDELESIIASKDAKMRALKDAISAALTNFEGNGLTVEQRDGKVYVSMENKLLFESGSWAVNSRGRQAVTQLGSVLAQNPEIAVLIEGHTDNVPFGGNGNIKNNWDLSTKRATAIVNILTGNNGIPKDNLTAAGRGEYAPVGTNNTSEGRAKNRRIEVVLTPKLDEINRLLNEI